MIYIHEYLSKFLSIYLGDNVDCWMEIQHGKGPWASVVNGIVPLGTTLTMVVGIKDKLGRKLLIYFAIKCLLRIIYVYGVRYNF